MDDIASKPRRSWRPRFSLRTLLVLTAVVAIAAVFYKLEERKKRFLHYADVHEDVAYEFEKSWETNADLAIAYVPKELGNRKS